MSSYYDKYIKYKVKYFELQDYYLRGGTKVATVEQEAEGTGKNEDVKTDYCNEQCNNLTTNLVDVNCSPLNESYVKGASATKINSLSKQITKNCSSKRKPDTVKNIRSFILEYDVDVLNFIPRKVLDLDQFKTTENIDDKITQFQQEIAQDEGETNKTSISSKIKGITSNKITTDITKNFSINKYIKLQEKLYTSENDFFSRDIYLTKEMAESFAKNLDKKNVVISPACARTVIYENVRDAKNSWIKGSLFSLEKLINIDFISDKNGIISSNSKILGEIVDSLKTNNSKIKTIDSDKLVPDDILDLFKQERCNIIVSRLAPTDYHRVHIPISGKLIYVDNMGGQMMSVQPKLVHDKSSNVYTQNRRINLWMYNESFGLFVVCLIGSTCAGSIVLSKIKTDKIETFKDTSKPDYVNNVLLNGDNYEKTYDIYHERETKEEAARKAKIAADETASKIKEAAAKRLTAKKEAIKNKEIQAKEKEKIDKAAATQAKADVIAAKKKAIADAIAAEKKAKAAAITAEKEAKDEEKRVKKEQEEAEAEAEADALRKDTEALREAAEASKKATAAAKEARLKPQQIGGTAVQNLPPPLLATFDNKSLLDKIGGNIDLYLGQQISIYEYGGSTTVTIIPKQNDKIITWCSKILRNSQNRRKDNDGYNVGVETLVHVGQFLGEIN